MNEEQTYNLPPDADDLSKHAPALFALQGKGEGFVVPENFFEEFTERAVSMTTLPSFDSAQDDNSVPENYFDELPSIVEAKTILPSSVGLIVPENYFEELPSIIEANAQLSDFDAPSENPVPEHYFNEFAENLEARIVLENVLPPAVQNDNAVSSGYFDEMESELHVHIALDNLKQEEGFVLPENYFSDLTERVLAETADVRPSGVEVVTGDITSEADPNVPDGYFEELPDRVLARVATEENKKPKRGRVVVFAEWTKQYWKPVSVAASVALLIATGWYFINEQENGNGSLKNNSYAVVTPDAPSVAPQVAPPPADTVARHETPTMVASSTPKKPKDVKPNVIQEVKMNDEEIIAQSDVMDETMVMDFVAESNVITPTEDVLDPAMMEYLMNDNAGLDVFSPTDKP